MRQNKDQVFRVPQHAMLEILQGQQLGSQFLFPKRNFKNWTRTRKETLKFTSAAQTNIKNKFPSNKRRVSTKIYSSNVIAPSN